MTDSFYNIVGFTSKDCTCIDDGRPVNYDQSYSGYFLEDSEHGVNLLIPQTSCGEADIWKKLTTSREEAINDFITHFGNKLSEKQNEILNNKSVKIGKSSYTKFLSGDSFRGLRIRPLIYKGATLVLSSIKVYSKVAETVTVTIVPSIGTAQTLEFACVAGYNQFITDAIRLPLSSNGEFIDYTIYHNSTEESVNNTIYCSSCTNKKVNYNGLLDVKGVSSDDESLITSTEVYKNRASGILIDARFECNALDWLTKVDSSFFKLNSYGRTVAKTLQMMWAVKTISQILSSDSINFYTTLTREELYGKRNKLNKLSMEMITILSVDIPESLSHCFICKAAHGFSKRSL